MGVLLVFPACDAFVKARGWWSPEHGGTHGVSAEHEGGAGLGGVAPDASFAVTVTRKGKEARFDVAHELFDWLGVPAHPIWADAERLQAKHPEYFSSPDEVVRHVADVLKSPWVAMPATDQRYTLVIAPLEGEAHRSAVIRFELRGNQYRVRSAQKMPEVQAAGKVARAGKSALHRRGRISASHASDVTSESQPSVRGPDTRLASGSPVKLDKSMANAIVFFKAQSADWLKAYIHGHYRTNKKTGQKIWVESYTDKRNTKTDRELFAHDNHRREHFRQNLAHGRIKEAFHVFHDLDHDAAHKLAHEIGLHDGSVRHADKRELMKHLHGNALKVQKALQAKLAEQEAKAKGKTEDKPAEAKGEPEKANEGLPEGHVDFGWIMDKLRHRAELHGLAEIDDIGRLTSGKYGIDEDADSWPRTKVMSAIRAMEQEIAGDKKNTTRSKLINAHDGTPLGLEVKHKTDDRYGVVLPDASEPGRYRNSRYDARGFAGHSTFDTPEEALDDLISQGYTEHAPGSLDRLASTDTWARGMQQAWAIQDANSKPPPQGAQHPVPQYRGPDPEDLVIDVGGEEVPFSYQVIDAADLDPTKTKADNQFRDRTRAASEEQVAHMAGNLKFRLLADSPMMDYGSPVLAKDGKTIIGGNGRSMAIGRAYAQGKADEYRASLERRAEKFGIDPETVKGMKAPVLVRVLAKDVDIKQAAIASNEGGGARMSALEQARVDGDRMGDLDGFAVGDDGNLNTAANAGFIRRFLASVPVAQRSAFQASDGGLSQEGITRMRNAVLFRAYGDSDVLARQVESADPGQRNVLNALVQVAPVVAQARADIGAGRLHDLDIAADIVAATSTLAKIKEEKVFGSAEEYLAQQDIFGDPLSDETKEILRFFDSHMRSAKAIGGFLRDYYGALRAVGDPNQGSLFGDPTPRKSDLMRQTRERNADQDPGQGSLFKAGRSARRIGAQARRQPAHASGPARRVAQARHLIVMRRP